MDPPSREAKMSLHKAVMDGMTDVVAAILLRGTDPNQRDEETGRTVAHCAVQVGNVAVLQLLKEHRADMSIYDYRSNTPLIEAVEQGKVDVVGWLLSNLPRQENVIEDMLFLAAACGQVQVMNLLLARGAVKESKDELGKNALLYAAENGQSNAVNFLIQRGADPAVSDDHKKTLLHAAAESGDPKTIELVLRHCLQMMDARDCSGDTPLHCAATTNKEAVAILLGSGAATDLRNEHGQTVLDLALQTGKFEIVDLLRQNNDNQYNEVIKGIVKL